MTRWLAVIAGAGLLVAVVSFAWLLLSADELASPRAAAVAARPAPGLPAARSVDASMHADDRATPDERATMRALASASVGPSVEAAESGERAALGRSETRPRPIPGARPERTRVSDERGAVAVRADELESACAARDGEACRALGDAFLRDEARAEDALLAYRDGCDVGHAASCAALGSQLLLKEESREPDLPEAMRVLRLACDLDVAECTSLASALLSGAERDADVPRALELLERSCGAGSDEGCTTLGTLYLRDDRVERDPVRAERALRAACDRGHDRACEEWAGLIVTE